MANRRVGFHNTNAMRTKWEAGVCRNRDRLDFAIANFKTWEANDGWIICPDYMRKLQRDIHKQQTYLRNRLGEAL